MQLESWDKKLTNFQKLLLIKAACDEKLLEAVTEFVRFELELENVTSLRPDLPETYKSLNKATPLTFILNDCSDPTGRFLKFVNEFGMNANVSCLSLGESQAAHAERVLREAMVLGDWVFLQVMAAKCWVLKHRPFTK